MATRPTFQIYDRTKTYMTPVGTMATPAWVAENYPAATQFPYIMETDPSGTVMMSMDPLANLRGIYSINPALTDAEAVEAITEAVYQRKVAEEEAAQAVSVEERTAAALEFLAMNSLPDEA